MSATAVSDFREVVRLVLGDDDPQGLYQYEDTQMDRAVLAVFQLGMQPSGYSIGEDLESISPAVSHGDDFALIVFKAAKLRMGGAEGGMTYRTRALTVRSDGQSKRDLFFDLEQRIHAIEGGSCCFASQRDFVVWVNDMSGGLLEKRLNWNGQTLSLSGTY